MAKQSSINAFTSMITVFLILYCFLLVDFIPKFDTSLFFNPLLRFFVLTMMLLASKFDMFICVLIGFAFIITKFVNELSPKKVRFQSQSQFKNSKYLIENDLVNNNNKMDIINSLTNEEHLDKAQSNIVDKKAMESEIKTWDDGYGTQGLSLS